jgi:hypothetical protein
MVREYRVTSNTLDSDIGKFSFAYTDSDEWDYASFIYTVKSLKIEVEFEE